MRGYDIGAARPRVVLDCSKDELLTEQQHVNEVDVTTIVRRMGLGQTPKLRPDGVYGDFSGIEDYESAREAVERADKTFALLDAGVRDRFGNSPGLFLRMVDHDPEEFVRRVQGPKKLEPGPGAAPAPEGAGGGGPAPAGS